MIKGVLQAIDLLVLTVRKWVQDKPELFTEAELDASRNLVASTQRMHEDIENAAANASVN